MACHTQEEIAEREGISQPQVKEVLSVMADLPKSIKPAADHLVDLVVKIPIVALLQVIERTFYCEGAQEGRKGPVVIRALNRPKTEGYALYRNRLILLGAPTWIRTRGLWIRSPTLYPAELWAHV